MDNNYYHPPNMNNSSNVNHSNQNFNPFEEYEWMMNMDEFDKTTMQEIEEEDELEELFYWDALLGCQGDPADHSKNSTRQNTDQAATNNPISQNEDQNQLTSPWYYENKMTNGQNTGPKPFVNPLSLADKDTSIQQTSSNSASPPTPPAPERAGMNRQNQFPTSGQTDNTNKQITSNPLAGLSHAFQQVDLDRFNFNPAAKPFVPSFLKK
jgi:hypothetical protein